MNTFYTQILLAGSPRDLSRSVSLTAVLHRRERCHEYHTNANYGDREEAVPGVGEHGVQHTEGRKNFVKFATGVQSLTREVYRSLSVFRAERRESECCPCEGRL